MPTLNMFNNIRLKAVALGALLGFVIPYLIASWWKVSVLGDVAQPHLEAPVLDYTFTYAFLFVVGPLFGGAVAAHLSRHQPVLHGVFAALLGWLCYSLMGAGVLIGVIFVAMSALGALAWKRLRA